MKNHFGLHEIIPGENAQTYYYSKNGKTNKKI